MIQTSPARSNTIELPSGDERGMLSVVEFVSCVGSLPSELIDQIEPERTKMILPFVPGNVDAIAVEADRHPTPIATAHASAHHRRTRRPAPRHP